MVRYQYGRSEWKKSILPWVMVLILQWALSSHCGPFRSMAKMDKQSSQGRGVKPAGWLLCTAAVPTDPFDRCSFWLHPELSQTALTSHSLERLHGTLLDLIFRLNMAMMKSFTHFKMFFNCSEEFKQFYHQTLWSIVMRNQNGRSKWKKVHFDMIDSLKIDF